MATTYTPNYHLGKQEDRSDKFLMQVITENMDIIDEQLKATDDKATAAAAGLKYKGAVNYYSDLPNDAEIGDAYTVLYAGSSGTVPDGTEYVWGELNGTAQWIDFSKDTYTKAEVDALLAAKQALLNANNKLNPAYINYDSTHRAVSDTEKASWNGKQSALSTAQLAAVNSGIDSTKVAQIEANKNNILTGNAALAVYAARLGTNLVNSASGSGSNWAHIPVVVPAGEYVVGFASITSASNTSGKVQVNIMYDETTLNTEYTTINLSDSPLICTMKTTDTSNRMRLYSEQSGGDSIGKAVSYTTAFICPKAVWDSYPSIQPYQS